MFTPENTEFTQAECDLINEAVAEVMEHTGMSEAAAQDALLRNWNGSDIAGQIEGLVFFAIN